ncbi:MAG TPA: dienelactone hydrolase family protein, partial [Thermoanaerobaculia bacterium]
MKTSLLLALFLAVGCASTAPAPVEPAAQTPSDQLNSTPRHDEWVRIPSNGRDLHAWVSYPERADKAPAILLIHENRGLTDWVRSVGDHLSKNGLLVIAPDLLSGAAPGGGRTKDFPSEDAAREAISGLDPARVKSDLDAAAKYVV